jgi:hypothetical protein
MLQITPDKLLAKIRREARPLAPHRDVPVSCAHCGRTTARQARQQKYCSASCREAARRRSRKAFLGQDTGAPTNPHEKVNGFSALPAPKSGSSIGLQGPRHVIGTEIFGGREWQQAVSPDGVICQVSALRKRALRNGGVS